MAKCNRCIKPHDLLVKVPLVYYCCDEEHNVARLNGRRTLPPGPVILTLVILLAVLVGLVLRQVRLKTGQGGRTAQPTSSTPARPVLQSATSAPVLMGKVADTANFRAGPGVQASVIKLLPAGTQVRLVARQQTANGGWYLVQVAGQEGWLSDQVLTIDPAVAAFVPVRTATPQGTSP